MGWWLLAVGAVVGFVLGRAEAHITDYIRKRRIRKAIVVELERMRAQCIAVRWTIAETKNERNTDIAGLMVGVLEGATEVPVTRERITEAMLDQMRRMANSQDACKAANREEPPGGIIAPAPLFDEVFRSHLDVLGMFTRPHARALLDAYAAAPGMNRIASDLQDYSVSRATMDPDRIVEADLVHAANQDFYEITLDDQIIRVDHALTKLE